MIPESTADQQPSITDHDVQPAVDSFLRALVQLANDSGLSMGLTLFVGGALISGQLVGGLLYFENFGREIENAIRDSSPDVDPAGPAGIGRAFAQWGEMYRLPAGGEEAAHEPRPEPSFIHLRDARILGPDGRLIPTNGGVWWRGRLTAVDGYSLGVLGQS